MRAVPRSASQSNRVEGPSPNVECRQDELSAFYNETFPPETRPSDPRAWSPPPPIESDLELVARAFAAKNGEKLKRLFFGDTSSDTSSSEADLALCSLLAFWFVNEDGIDRAFRQSALYRRKWERDDYRARTIKLSLRGRTVFYDATRRRKKQPRITMRANRYTFTTAGGEPTKSEESEQTQSGIGVEAPADGEPPMEWTHPERLARDFLKSQTPRFVKKTAFLYRAGRHDVVSDEWVSDRVWQHIGAEARRVQQEAWRILKERNANAGE